MIPTQKPSIENILSSGYNYIRTHARHFFPTMLRVNAIYTIATCVFLFTVMNFASTFMNSDGITSITSELFGFGYKHTVTNAFDPDTYALMDIAQGGSSLNYIVMGISGLVILIAGVVFMAFTPAYMTLENKNGEAPTYSQIMDFMRARAGKLITMVLFFILLYIPVALIMGLIVVLLAISIIGIPLIPIVLVLLFLLMGLVVFAYLENDDISFFQAMDRAWNILMTGFWRNVLSFALVLLIVYVLTQVLKLLFSIPMMGLVGTHISTFSVTTMALVALIFHFIVTTIVSINIGMIFFYGKRQLLDKKQIFTQEN